MTDQEITRLCAEAMTYTIMSSRDVTYDYIICRDLQGGLADTWTYQPLRDDAQAMRLIKTFKVDLVWCKEGVTAQLDHVPFVSPKTLSVYGTDLNRAICECVAQMQKAKVL